MAPSLHGVFTTYVEVYGDGYPFGPLLTLFWTLLWVGTHIWSLLSDSKHPILGPNLRPRSGGYVETYGVCISCQTVFRLHHGIHIGRYYVRWGQELLQIGPKRGPKWVFWCRNSLNMVQFGKELKQL
jgi:hypothetical protein